MKNEKLKGVPFSKLSKETQIKILKQRKLLNKYPFLINKGEK